MKSHQKLELKVLLLRYWLRFKSIISLQKLEKIIFLISQRAVARSWSSWRNQTTRSTSIRSIQSAILLSLVQSAFSALRAFGLQARQSSFMRISIRQITVIRALSSWRTQANAFGALQKASIYFRLFSLKSSLELFRVYAAGAADHIRATNLFIQSRTFYIRRCDARRLTTVLRVAFARTLSLVDHSFQMIRKSAIDRARSKVLQESASVFRKFPSFAAWIQFRGDSIRFNFSIQIGRLHHIFQVSVLGGNPL